jgi:SAM-dependent methyltransferase
MNGVFGSAYAQAYDDLYRDKDYPAECDLLTGLFQEYGDGSIHRILDLGCGTGNHAIPLAQQGHHVVGVERSATMLAQAQSKAAQSSAGSRVAFHAGDIRSVNLQQQFDAVLMMFAVLGYQPENADVRAALRTARRHLRPQGLLLLDVWYGPAVLRERPSQRIKIIPAADGKILRVASGELDSLRHLCTVHYLLWQISNDRCVAETEESHTMRFFFPRELELFLQCQDFELLRLGGFPEFHRDPDDTTWNVLVVARAVGKT